MTNKMTDKFEIQMRDELTHIEADIDPNISQQLTLARRKAIDCHTKPWARYVKQILWPTAGMVMASFLVFVVILGPTSPLLTHDNLVVDEQSIDNIELLEDLDFYYWLSENETGLRG
jgi:hypothetical protein